MAEARWLDDDERRAWRGLQFMNLRLSSELARALAQDSDLSYPDYTVLVALTAQPEDRIRASELGCALGWEQSRLSHQVARMADRGLVAKEKCDSDRRGTWVAATAQGRRAIEAAAPGHAEAVRRLFLDVVTPEQLAVIADVAEEVLAHLDALRRD